MTRNVGIGKYPIILQGILGNGMFLCRKFRRVVILIMLSEYFPGQICLYAQIYYY